MKIKVCPAVDIQNNQSIKFTVPGEKYDREGFLIKFKDKLKAFFNECPHIGLALDWDDNDFFSNDLTKLVCKNHGAEFNPHDGDCTAGPCTGVGLKPINVSENEGDIYVTV